MASNYENEEYMVPTTVDEVREFVMNTSIDEVGRSKNLLLLSIKHSNLKKTNIQDIRLDKRISVDELKQKLYAHTGSKPINMKLYHNNEQLLDVNKRLYEYNIISGDTIYLLDDDPLSVSANGWLEDVSLVPKYKISEEKYNENENTYRRYKEKMKLNNPNWSMTSALKQNNPNLKINYSIDTNLPSQFQIGSRCEIFPGAKRATIMYMGKNLKGLPQGWWIGVHYDEPVGKNDGSVNGIKYFTVQNKFGGFVRPSNITVGDFPPLSIDDDDEEEL